MRKTKILAFVLTVVMLFSVASVCASAYTYDELKGAVGDSNIIYYSDFEGLTLGSTATDTKGVTLNKGGTLAEYSNSDLFSSLTFRDYWGGENNKGPNISSDGHGVVSSEWPSTTVPSDASGDDNNCLDVNLVDTEALRGKDMVLSTSVTALSDEMVSSGAFIYYAYCNHGGDVNNPSNGNNQIKSSPFKIAQGYALTFGSTTVMTLKKGVTVDIAIHIRIVEPTAPGTYNVNDFSGSSKLSEDALTAKYGKVVYDAYVDGILVAKDLLFVDRANQAKIATKDRGQLNTAEKIAANLDSITGRATDYKVTYFRLAGTGGSGIKGSTTAYDGEPVIRQDSVGLYLSETYPEKYNSANTVEGYDLTINNGVLGLNYYLNLQSDVLTDENAKVVFTTPRGVQEVAVKGVAAETNGSYKFTATVSSVEMAKDITMEIKSGEKVYNIYKNGAKATEHTYSVKAYAEQLLSDATYGKIAKAMLNYGAYAQEYFKFDTENLANANCGYTTELSAVNNDVSNVSITGDAPAGTKAALVLDSNTSIVIYDKDGNKIGEKKGINSLELDTEYTIELTGGTSVTVSVLAIGEKVLESDATSQSYKDLIKTLKLFSDASKELNP